MNQSLPEGRKHVPASLQPKQIYPFQTPTFTLSCGWKSAKVTQPREAQIPAARMQSGLRDQTLVESRAFGPQEWKKKGKGGIGQCEDDKDLYSMNEEFVFQKFCT